MTRLLRLVAFAIAVAGIVDPAFTLSGASRARVAVLALRSAPPAAADVRERLVRDLGPSLQRRSLCNERCGGRDRDRRSISRPIGLARKRCVSDSIVSTGWTADRDRHDSRTRSDWRAHRPRRCAARGSAGDRDSRGCGARRARRRWTDDCRQRGCRRPGGRPRVAPVDASNERWRAGIDVVPIGEPPYVVQVRLKPDTTETADAVPVVSGLAGLCRHRC